MEYPIDKILWVVDNKYGRNAPYLINKDKTKVKDLLTEKIYEENFNTSDAIRDIRLIKIASLRVKWGYCESDCKVLTSKEVETLLKISGFTMAVDNIMNKELISNDRIELMSEQLEKEQQNAIKEKKRQNDVQKVIDKALDF